jgi:hypothetical protein
VVSSLQPPLATKTRPGSLIQISSTGRGLQIVTT